MLTAIFLLRDFFSSPFFGFIRNVRKRLSICTEHLVVMHMRKSSGGSFLSESKPEEQLEWNLERAGCRRFLIIGGCFMAVQHQKSTDA